MKLKRLEINGFKSFQDKTVLLFDKDIGGVVGPNGCGKSNIVDAIRWVMGEQSAKHLRGRQMEDVIFSGSEKRPPLSMARVELTFSSEGSQTPAAYLNHPEISISRCLYRTGESEYSINKVPVRLKDITDLFLGTGIGTKAYSVIEQDRVSQIITAKPEDRRFYIEEVAGISRFRSRKEAALRKMEATQQNLLRITDLTAELERQLLSLDRQARKAEKYKKIRDEYRTQDLTLSATLYARHNQQQESLESELKNYDEKECVLRARLQECENSLEECRLKLEERDREINHTQNRLFETKNTIQLGETTLRYKEEEQEGIIKRREVVRQDIEELMAEITGVANGSSQVNEQRMIADFEEASLNETLAEAQVEVDVLQNNLLNRQRETEELRERTHAVESRLNQILTTKTHLMQKKVALQGSAERDRREVDNLHVQYEKIARICVESRNALEGLKQLKLNLRSQTDGISDALKQHRLNLQGHQEELLRVKEGFTLRKSRLSSLKELEKNFEGYHEGTRSVLMKKEELGRGGILGSVADFIEAEPRYEGAVSAVLGEKLQYVVVRSHEEGVEAIDYLRSQAHGRSSFIPMHLRSSSSDQGEIPAQEGVLGSLKQFVTLKGGSEPLTDFLFGDVVLVEDLKKALDIWASNGHKKTLVTLDGEVVDPTGVITGGSLANTSKALLEKKREIKELDTMIAQLEGDVRGKEVECSQLADHVHKLESTLESVRQSSVEEEIKIAGQEKDVDQMAKEIELIRTKEKTLEEEIGVEGDELERVLNEIESVSMEEGEKTLELTELRKVMGLSKGQLEELRLQFEEETQNLTRVKIELAQALERKLHLESEEGRLGEDGLRLRRSRVEKRKEEFSLLARDQFLRAERTHLLKMLEKRLKIGNQIEVQFKEQRELYETEARQIREREVSLKEMRQTVDEATQRLNQITVSLTEVRGQIKQLVEQCLERHQLDLKEIYRDHIQDSMDEAQVRERVADLRGQLGRLGDVNTAALQEYEEIKERFDFLCRQRDDLSQSLKTLEQVIHKINRTTKERFFETYQLVNEKFMQLFTKLFRGGEGRLVLTDENNLLETGVEIVAQPPGKKLQSISLLSGGEKALTAVSLIFAIFQIKPSPFCILDEVDAPLDDANVDRYNEIIHEMTPKTQFILITHNKRTMEMADILYGVTMQEAGISQLVAVTLN